MSDTETQPQATEQPVVERAFLIADVRGYTRFTRERGDAAAARLAGAFAALARDAVAARGGRVIELRGDEALAVFTSPAQAVRAAVDLVALCEEEVAGNPDLPLLVGVGVDSGPAVPLEGGYRGAAINTAARLCSRAAAGEVLVPAALMQRAGPVRGVISSPRDALELKGFEAPLPVVEVSTATGRRDRPAQAPVAEPVPIELEVETPLVGREDEMCWLRGSWRTARRGEGRLLVLSGVEGIGRTRLAAELAAVAGRDGLVRYAGAGGTAQAVAEAELRSAATTEVPLLAVIDDVDVLAEALAPQIVAMADDIERRPALVICLASDPDASPTLAALIERADRDGDGYRRLEPLGAEAVHEIIDLYAGDAAGEVSVESIVRASGGVPERVHELMSEWAEREAARRLEAAAEYLSAQRLDRRRDLEFANNVIGLKLARLYTAAPESGARGPMTCPYQGLASFDEDDSRFFFGRERLVGELAARTVGTGLLAIVGASGSGKSSVLAAGLVPSLRAGLLPGSERWQVASMRPGQQPARELDSALTSVAEGDARRVLVIDQFEELFSADVRADERSAVVDTIVQLASDPERGIVILGLRADFYGRCAAHPELARLVASNQVLLGPMTDSELRRAIELPARRLGVRVDGALVEELVGEVVDQPGGLPLLSTALVELWGTRSGGWLRLDAYQQAGGVTGAVARLAESSYEQLTDPQREVARALFLRLVTTGEDGTVARRVVRREELGLDPGSNITAVVSRLTADRLLTVSDDTVEVAHEALLREWPRLVEWLREDAQGRELREHLMQAARRWQAAGQDASELYRGTRLTATLDWAAGRSAELNEAEQEFLRESRAASERDAERQRRSNRRLRTLLAVVSVVSLLAVAAGIVALVQRSSARHQATVALGRQLGAEAVSEPRIDRAMLLARQSLAFDRSTQTEGTLLATLLRSPALTGTIAFPITVRPLQVAVSPDGRTIAVNGNDALLHIYDTRTRSQVTAVDEGGLPAVYMPHSDQLFATPAGPGDLRRIDGRTGHIVRQYAWGTQWENATGSGGTSPVVVSPDGRYVFVLWAGATPAGRDGPAYLQRWPVDPPGKGEVQPTVIPLGERGVITAGATADGHIVAVTDGAITTWNMRSLDRVARTPVRGIANPLAAALSPDGGTVGYGKQDGTVHFVDVATGRTTDGSGAHSAGVVSVVFSPNSRLAVSTADDGLVIVWDPTTGAIVERLAGHGGRVINAAFAADGHTLYTSSLDGTVLQWDLSGARRFGAPFNAGHVALDGAAATLPGVLAFPPAAMSPDGRVLAVRSGNHGVRLFSVSTLRRTGSLSLGAKDVVTSLAWAGGRLLVGGANGEIREWATGQAPHQLGVLHGLSHVARFIAVSPDGHLVAAVDGTWKPAQQGGGDLNGNLVIWRNGELLRSVKLGSPGNALAFSEDGRLLAVARDTDPSVVVYDVQTGRRIQAIKPETGTIDLAFASNDTLATGSWEGIVTLWNPETGAPIGKPTLVSPSPVSSIAVDPSGSWFATVGGSSGQPRIWDTSTQQPVGSSFPGGDGQWGTLAWTPDGRYMLVVFADGTAYRWPVSVAAWEAHACAVAGRNLTHEEWHRYVGTRGYQRTCPMFGPGV